MLELGRVDFECEEVRFWFFWKKIGFSSHSGKQSGKDKDLIGRWCAAEAPQLLSIISLLSPVIRLSARLLAARDGEAAVCLDRC
ncbi:unnamed protein product [Pleuronectes platessa]|uniref:Uncharacterized protein n=1 Tax=Pleuronectes platessa TaxID=8262 RepID=A0A9N7VS45_PLEPL|nr:unnamed protein product [Pleuronectes platessa]